MTYKNLTTNLGKTLRKSYEVSKIGPHRTRYVVSYGHKKMTTLVWSCAMHALHQTSRTDTPLHCISDEKINQGRLNASMRRKSVYLWDSAPHHILVLVLCDFADSVVRFQSRFHRFDNDCLTLQLNTSKGNVCKGNVPE